MKTLRFDYVFSYWIFAWYLLYIFHIINYNPKFALIIGIIENIIYFIIMILSKKKFIDLFLFIIINICIKIIPFITVMNDTIIWRDITATFVLFIIYNIWLYINSLHLLKIFKRKTPGIVLLKRMLNIC